MMRFLSMAALALTVGCSSSPQYGVKHDSSARFIASDETPNALFSPTQGEAAFAKLYDIIGNAREYAYITVYSWSDSGLNKAIMKALAAKAKVRVVLHPALKETAKVITSIKDLEDAGAEFKWAPINMHEKFTLVDDHFLINTSANFSNGAKTKYSENMVFMQESGDPSNAMNSALIDFKNEFAVLWDVSKDIQTHGEPIAEPIRPFVKPQNEPTQGKSIALHSSSMNWTLKENAPSSAAYKDGRFYTMEAKKIEGSSEQTWIVRDLIIDSIRKAKKNIFLSLNHFNIRMVADELLAAVKRGVDVRLAVDNQEYKNRVGGIEMTPVFVAGWAKLKGKDPAPVRVKYYSHAPSPAYWLLNHHKYILIDFDEQDASNTVLLTGSYNLSRTAEQNQFDNLVAYRSARYKDLYADYYTEFLRLWDWNRENGQPKKSVWNLFFTMKDGSYPLHINEAMALTWEECGQIRSEISKKAPGIFTGIFDKRDCMYYNPVKKSFWGCPGK